MTILQAHNIAHTLGHYLSFEFAEQLALIDSNATICYHNHYDKFTLSIYSLADTPTSIVYSTDLIDIYSHFEYSDAIEQLAFDITEYITKEQPCIATKNYTEPMQTAIAE